MKLLPPTHAKIFNSYNRLAYLYGINAMRNGELAHKEIEKLLADRDRTGDGEKLRSSSESILRRLGKVMKFGDLSEKVFLEQLRKDEQKEECERVRALVSQLQEKLFDKWIKDHSANP